MGPNNSFKPKLLRSGNGVAEKACHAVACATQFGLTQALGTAMPRDFRRFTTVDDLLDDGVENNSDLAARIARYDDDRDTQPTPDDPEVLRIREETIARVDREHARADEAAQKQSYSIIGVVIGLSLVIPGLALLFHPVDMLVEHRRVRYLASVFEHITVERSIFYSSFVVIFGLAIIYFSTRRFRK